MGSYGSFAVNEPGDPTNVKTRSFGSKRGLVREPRFRGPCGTARLGKYVLDDGGVQSLFSEFKTPRVKGQC